MTKFAIIGGGIGGLTLAIAMQRKGMEVKVYESAPRFRPLGAGIALAANAMKAFTEIGIADEVIKAGKKINGMYIKDAAGKVITFTDAEQLTKQFGVINNFTIHRANLHEVLSGLLQPDTIVFGKMCVDVDPASLAGGKNDKGVSIHFSDGSKVETDYVIACDGIHSPIRKKLLPGSIPRYAGYTCWRAVVDTLPAGLNVDETTETWGSGRRFGVVPLSNDRVYWFATLNAKAGDPKMRDATTRDLVKYFEGFHFPIPELLRNTNNDQLIWSDIIDLKPVKKFAFRRIVLIGDAAHATTPNMGQGACMAIEDAATLANGLVKYSPEEAFKKFEEHRIKRTTDIVEQSWSVGKIAQLENPVLRFMRNGAFRRIPKSMIDKQVESLYNVSFNY
jgi:2-polyprenyl-6-methoxyphenol hydroxylase-like FAD-dependent oxidoreductase